ncbi:MAG: rhomboid family intramembrane serine protease [Sphingomonas fennica]
MQQPPARATIALVGVTIFAWAAAVASGQEGALVAWGGFIPARVNGALAVQGALPVALTPLSAALLHGGAIHLLFNMLVLGFCGKATERVIGPGPFLFLYVAGAYVAALFQFLADAGGTLPMIGASGAASAVIAAYAIFYGERRQLAADRRVSRLLNLAWLAAAWVALQLLVALATNAVGILIAAAAHIGGFLAGMALAQPLLRWRYRRA